MAKASNSGSPAAQESSKAAPEQATYGGQPADESDSQASVEDNTASDEKTHTIKLSATRVSYAGGVVEDGDKVTAEEAAILGALPSVEVSD